MKIKFSKKVPKVDGIYFYRDTNDREVQLLYVIGNDFGSMWVHDYPSMKSSEPLADFTGEYKGQWSNRLEFQ